MSTEKDVNLNEDLGGHGHDQVTYQKALAKQEQARKELEKNKAGNK
jgi:hypothetical protein